MFNMYTHITPCSTWIDFNIEVMIRVFWHDCAKKNSYVIKHFAPPQEICELALLFPNQLSHQTIWDIADDLQDAGVRLEMMPTCFVNKLLLYYTIQCHAQGFGSCFKCWPFNDTFTDIFNLSI